MPRAAVVSGRVSLQIEVGATGLSPAALVGALTGGGTVTGENLQLAGLDPNAIGAAVQAADRGVLIDSVRIGDVVRGALDGGRLTIPYIGGAVALSDGRLTVGPLGGPAQNADIAISGGYGLGEDMLDLRFDLTGPPAPDALDAKRPQLSVALSGPLAAARRNVDVTALVNWLTLRSVEREAKRLEAAEKEAKRIQAEEEARRKAQEEARRRAQDEEARRRAQEAARRAQEAEMPTSGIGAPPLPPPIEIKPWPEPTPRHAPPRSERVPTTPPAPPPLTMQPGQH
jgi:large subunit ribosomal protein L24